MVGSCTIKLKEKRAEWLTTLLRIKFFGSCDDHQDLKKNEKNMFCVDCSIGLCKHCMNSSTHCLHQWFQICKYVYHDVVRLQDIQKHLDCSKIQERNHIPVPEFDNLCLKENANESKSLISLSESSAKLFKHAWFSSPKLKPKRQLNKRKGVPLRAPLQ